MKRLLLLAALLLVATPAHAQDWLMQMARQFYTIRVGPQYMIGPAQTFSSTAADSGTGVPMDTRYARNLIMHFKVYRNATAAGDEMVRFYVSARSHIAGSTDTSAVFRLQPKRHFVAVPPGVAADTLKYGYTNRTSGGDAADSFEFPVMFDPLRSGSGGVAIYWSDVFSGPPPAYTSFVVRKAAGQTCLMTLTVEGCP